MDFWYLFDPKWASSGCKSAKSIRNGKTNSFILLRFDIARKTLPGWQGVCIKGASDGVTVMKQKTVVRGIEVVAVGETSVLKALGQIAACQGCSPSISRSFGSVLLDVLGPATTATEYLMSEPVPCPSCSRPMFENTLVRCVGEREAF